MVSKSDFAVGGFGGVGTEGAGGVGTLGTEAGSIAAVAAAEAGSRGVEQAVKRRGKAMANSRVSGCFGSFIKSSFGSITFNLRSRLREILTPKSTSNAVSTATDFSRSQSGRIASRVSASNRAGS